MRRFLVALLLAIVATALLPGAPAACQDASCQCPAADHGDPSAPAQGRSKSAYLPAWARLSLLQRRWTLWAAGDLEEDAAGPHGPVDRAAEGHGSVGKEGRPKAAVGEELLVQQLQQQGPAAGKSASGPGAAPPAPAPSSIADLQGVNQRDDLLALAHALATDSGLVIAYTIVFWFLRRYFPLIYMNNVLTGKASLSKSRTCCGRVCSGCCRAPEEVEEIVGLDGAMFIEFPKLCLRILLCIGVPLVCVVWPLNCASVRDRGGICLPMFNKPFLDLGLHIYWVQAGAVWLVVLTAELNIILAQRAFAKRRQEWLRKMPRPWSTTVLVENIPPESRSDAELRRCFEDRFSRDAVLEAYVVRRTGALPVLVQAAAAARQRLAEANAKWKRMRWAPEARPTHVSSGGQQVDSIFCYGEEVKQAEQAATEGLERFRRTVCSSESDLMAGSGFVTLRRRQDAASALVHRVRLRGQELLISTPPEPDDVVYSDLMQDPRDRLAMEFVGYVCVGLVFFCFTPLTLAIISITRLKTLREYVPVFNTIVSTYPEIHAFWDGMMGSFVLNLVMGFVPTIFALIFRQCYALKSELWRQQRVQRWYFYFLVIFVLLVTAIGASLALVYLELARSPARIFDLLASSLPGASQFYLKFIMLQWAVEALQPTRHMILVKFLFYRFRGHDKERARELAEPEDQDYDGIGARSARLTLMLVIALVFSTVSPLVCPLAFVHFCLCWATYSNLLMFAEGRKHDLGGVFWCTQLKHVQQALFFYVALMVGILVERAADPKPGMVAAGSFAVLVPCYLWFRRMAWDDLPLEEAAAYDLAPARATSATYVQPELRDL